MAADSPDASAGIDPLVDRGPSDANGSAGKAGGGRLSGPTGIGTASEKAGADVAARRDRRRAMVRLVAIVVVVVLAAVFIVQNLHPVTVHLWIVRRQLGLVWVIGGCLVAGVAVGYWVGWQGQRQAAQRRAERAARGGRRWRRRTA